MNKHITTIFILMLCMLHTMYAQDTIRIMTLNIDHGSEASLQTIGTIIKSYNPDLIALQEVDIYPAREYVAHQKGKNFIAELSYYSDMQGVFGKALDHPGRWDYGDAILSKHSFSKSESIILKNLKDTEPRQLVVMHTCIKGHDICFASTHLCNISKENRSAQLRQIKKFMQKQKEKIQFVCGDLNSDTKENIVLPIMKHWRDALPAEEKTFTSNPTWHYKELKLDYILYNYQKNKNIEVSYSTIECNELLTDHCIGIADIIIH